MIHMEFPYGKVYNTLDLPRERVQGILRGQIAAYDPGKSQEELVEESLRRPIGSPGLAELSRGKDRVTIIASDHTRPVPSRLLIPPMLREIRRGNPGAEITILIATGCHRGTTRRELADKFGPEIVERERIVVHDCDSGGDLRFLGLLPSGGQCWVNRWACEADLLVSEGFIEPHFLPATPAAASPFCQAWRAAGRCWPTTARSLSTVPAPGRASLPEMPSMRIWCGRRKRLDLPSS